MSLDEYYRRLELPGTASPAEVKRAYRRLRAKYHPDRNKGREATVEPAFKRVQEAFEILAGVRQAPASSARSGPTPEPRPQPRPQAWAKEPDAAPRESRHRPPMRGANCMTELFVPLEIAIHGGELEATYGVHGPCSDCQGHASSRCSTCRGTRIAACRKTVRMTIAPGAWDGQRLVVEGAGHPGAHGGPAGDATFSIVIVCSSAFRREGLNIACELQVDFVTAMLGGSLDARILGQTTQVTIPAHSRQGSAIRLRGQGLSDRNGVRGDLTLYLVLAMPAEAAHLTDDDRRQLREMFAAAQGRARQAAGGES